MVAGVRPDGSLKRKTAANSRWAQANQLPRLKAKPASQPRGKAEQRGNRAALNLPSIAIRSPAQRGADVAARLRGSHLSKTARHF